MSLFTRERGGLSWKDQTLDSISAPPSSLVVFFTLFIGMIYFTSYSESKQRAESSNKAFRLSLALLPLVAVVVVNIMVLRRWWWREGEAIGVPRPVVEEVAEEGSSPWWMMLVVLVLLVMAYYHS